MDISFKLSGDTLRQFSRVIEKFYGKKNVADSTIR
jgi:hypothetical protein